MKIIAFLAALFVTNATAQGSCAVMIKGLPIPQSEASSDAMKAFRFWTMVRNEIVDELGNYLVTGHHVTVIEIPHAEAPRTREHVAAALTQRQCNRIISLQYDVDQDASGPFFAFTTLILRPTGATGTLKEDYRRAYRFKRTMEVIERFSVRGFASTVFDDMEKAGVLDALRR